jgi:UDP:flavonoid glycosyltransferase YjiC (YdhE family)
LYLVPSLPDLEPLPPNLPHTHYIGPLIRSPHKAEVLPDWLNQFDPARPLVYVTIGGGAGPVGGPRFYTMLMEALGDTQLQVIASTGAKLSPAMLPPPPPNIRLEPWVPGPAVIARSDLVVFHGGYGTTMELVQAGVPGLIIPFHSEQESNARRLEVAGAARVLLPSQKEPTPVWHRWPGGRFCTLIHPESDLTPLRLRTAILDMVVDETFQVNAQRLQTAAQPYKGSSQAADLIEELLKSRSAAPAKGWDRLSWWQKLSLRW